MIRQYFNEQAAIWDETVAEKDAAKLERMAERLDIESGATVLDVGTGTGVFLPYLVNSVGHGGRIIALDIAEEMLQTARAKNLCDNVDYLHADVTTIPVRGELFDVIVCYSSVPHFRDKPGVLGEIHRVTRPGGRLFICHTSSRTQINQIHVQIPAVNKDILPDRDEMRAWLSAAGFTGIEIDDGRDSYLASARKTIATSASKVETCGLGRPLSKSKS